MIEEIFLVSNEKVLIGDPKKLPKNALYPTHNIKNTQFSQIRLNNIMIGILYSNIDVFYILDQLQIIKKNLENKFNNIDEKMIYDNYFLVKEMIDKNNLRLSEYNLQTDLPILSTNEIFIDVIETYHAIIDEEFIFCDVFGFCFVKPRFNEDNFLKLLIKKDDNIQYISNYKIVERFNKLELELNVNHQDLQILKYKTKGNLPLKLLRENDNFILYTDDIIFDKLEILIPVSKYSKSVKSKTTKGKSFYDENKNIVKWQFNKEKVGKSSLNLQYDIFEKYEDQRSIQISFNIFKTNKNILNIEKAICLDNSNVDVWIKYDICNGKVEYR